jgi:hypothetical protein
MVPLVIALGLVRGLAVGRFRSLPDDVLRTGNRAHGMGGLHTCCFAVAAGMVASTCSRSGLFGSVRSAWRGWGSWPNRRRPAVCTMSIER